jgi:hypothetical protein
MSIHNSIKKIIEEYLDNYINCISEKFNLDKTELKNILENPKKNINKNVTSDVKVDSNLNKMSKRELVELCKIKGLKYSGTKASLISYIQNGEKKQDIKLKKEKNIVLNNLVSKIPEIAIRRNNFGNFAHPETDLVFDNLSKKVIGKQKKDGTIENLNKETIELCKQYKFNYDLPSNLNNKALNEVDISNLCEEVEEEEVEEEEVEEEEVEEEEVEEESEEELIEEELLEESEEELLEEESEEELLEEESD